MKTAYICKRCGHQSVGIRNCSQCGYDHIEIFRYDGLQEVAKLDKFQEDMKYNPEYDPVIADRIDKELRKQSSANTSSYTPKPKCPTCGSTNIKDISTLNRVVSVGLFGLASGKIGKTKECKSCGYKW